jgi:hypothetical protein
MTAKEKLRQAVEELTELEAEDTLAYLARQREHDCVIEAFDDAPLEDEPITEEEERAVEESREAHRRGETFTREEIRQELGF